MSLLNEFSIDHLEVLNEFDTENFISLSNYNLGKSDDNSQVSFSINMYTDILNKTYDNVKDIELNRSLISRLSNLEKYNIRANELNTSEIITINIQYLDNYIESTAKMLDGVLKGEINEAGVKKFISPVVLEGVKKNAVKTTVASEVPNVLKLFKFKKENQFKVVNVDNSYVRRELAPFIDNYSQKRDTLITELKSTIAKLTTSGKRLTNIINTMNTIKSGESISKETKEKLTYAMYYSLRNIIEVIAYITAMTIQKVEIFTSNTMICNDIASKADNAVDIVSESYGPHVGVVPSDQGSLADAITGGDISAFKILANNIYELHAHNLKNPDVPKGADEIEVSPDGQFVHGYLRYKKDVYENIIKDLIEIGQGIDFITGRIDQFLLVSDDIINNSGFVMSLYDKYTADLNAIEDISNYMNIININTTGEFSNGLYQTILSEISEYTINMQKIANAFQQDMTRIDSLRKVISREHNGDFNNVEPMNELKTWLENFTAEFNNFAGKIAESFLNRLKALGETINTIKAQEETPTENTGDELKESVDYDDIAYEGAYDLTMIEHEFITHMLEIEYYTEKALLDKNKVFMMEADAPAPTQPQNNQNNGSTTPKIIDNSPDAGSHTGLINKIINSITEWFNKVKETFIGNNKKLVNTPKGKEVIANIKKIQNRDYNNVSIQILPYNNIDVTSVAVQDITNKLIPAIKQITPQTIQGIRTKEDFYNKLFNFISGGVNKNASFADQIKNYYKVGSTSNNNQLTTISNDALRTYVASNMIPYVQNYATSISESLTDATTKLNEALNEKLKTFNTVSENENATPTVQPQQVNVQTPVMTSDNSVVNGDMFTEAPNPNTTTSMSGKAKWMSSLCQMYIGAIYNALSDRYRDYSSALYGLIPKEEIPNPNEQNEQVVEPTNPTV